MLRTTRSFGSIPNMFGAKNENIGVDDDRADEIAKNLSKLKNLSKSKKSKNNISKF